jgi:hypothetical protein
MADLLRDGRFNMFNIRILGQLIRNETEPNMCLVHKAKVESGQNLTQLAISWTERSLIVAAAQTFEDWYYCYTYPFLAVVVFAMTWHLQKLKVVTALKIVGCTG